MPTTPRTTRELQPGDVLTMGDGLTIGLVVHVLPGAEGYAPEEDVWTLRAVAVAGYASDSAWAAEQVWLIETPTTG